MTSNEVAKILKIGYDVKSYCAYRLGDDSFTARLNELFASSEVEDDVVLADISELTHPNVTAICEVAKRIYETPDDFRVLFDGHMQSDQLYTGEELSETICLVLDSVKLFDVYKYRSSTLSDDLYILAVRSDLAKYAKSLLSLSNEEASKNEEQE